MLFDAVLHLLALALLDQAFKANIQKVDDFYRIRVPSPRKSLAFRWRKSMRDIPIFRQAVSTNDGAVRTSNTEALRYHTYLYYLQRLGLVTGFMQILNPYCIRRGSGEAVESTYSGRCMASFADFSRHRNASTAATSHVPHQRGDLPSLHQSESSVRHGSGVLGRPSNKALLKAAGHMSRHADPRAPTDASAIELKRKSYPSRQ